MKVEFSADNAFGNALGKWLKQLSDNHGDRASIRRCDRAEQVAFQPAFVRFYASELGSLVGDQRGGAMRMAAICGLASHLRFDDPKDALRPQQPLARQMASPKQVGGGPRISELRFRRLLQYERGELYRALLRVIRALDGRVNACDLADSVYYWGDSVRKRWAFDYFPNVKTEK